MRTPGDAILIILISVAGIILLMRWIGAWMLRIDEVIRLLRKINQQLRNQNHGTLVTEEEIPKAIPRIKATGFILVFVITGAIYLLLRYLYLI